MTMARINDSGDVVEVGIPERLRGTPGEDLHSKGWRPVKGTPKPKKPKDGSGYEYTYPYTYNANEDAVYGTWQQTDVIDRINDAKAKGIREQRDTLLDESDFAVMPDSPVADVEPWKAYRQALRDVPQQAGFPNDIEWPEEPSTE